MPVTSFNVSSINGQTGDITGVVFESDLLWGMGTGQDALLQKNGNNTASGNRAITIGQNNDNGGSNSFVGGVGNDLDNNSFKTFVWGNNIDAKGVNSGFITGGNHDINVVNASATYLFVCGTSNRVLGGSTVFVEGNNNTANANFSHVEGQYNTVIGSQAHAQNQYTLASGTNSHTGGQGKGIGSPLRLVTASGVASFNHSRIYDDNIGSDAKGENSFIAGGSDNNIGNGTQGQNSHIAGGQKINMQAQFSGSVGGQDIELNGTNVGTLGGKDHLIDNGISNSAIVGGEGILADRDNTAYTDNIEVVGECSMLERQATQSQNTSSQIKWLIDLTKGNMFNCFTDNKSSVILDFTKPNPNQKSSTFVIDLKDTNTDQKTLAFTTTSNMDIFYTDDTIDVGVNKKTEIWGRYSKSDNAIYLSTNGGFIKAN